MTFDEWSLAYPDAAAALQGVVVRLGHPLSTPHDDPEAQAQALVRLEASQLGHRLWRNNVGAGKLETGSYIRWGLCNDSVAVNAALKSADLIGLRRVLITPDMVGSTIAQFMSIEVKRPGWHYTGTPREISQLHWAELILGFGGYAAIVTGPGAL